MMPLCRTAAALLLAVAAVPVQALPALADPGLGTLERIVQNTTALPRIDGLALDAHGNLFAALETANSRGGVVHIDKSSGAVTPISIGVITGADQIAFDPGSGTFYVTNEFTPANTVNRLFRVSVAYDGSNRPTGGSAASLVTDRGLYNPEGLVVLPAGGPFGPAGTVYVAEDALTGGIHAVHTGTNPATVTTLVPDTANLNRPEGLAYGDFGGRAAPALYAAETNDGNLLRIDALGQVGVFGNPAAVGLTLPDNVEFGPDGFLYVSEDRGSGQGRIVRIAADGTHGVVATGFSSPQGLIFDGNGDLYIAEQDTASLWRLRFNPVPAPGSLALLALGLGLIRLRL
jgi:hypothetical protein